ncbi:unnamed protein product [Lactuca saligna]|uniref:Protein kinase domain-containing protein n=1 Tax=Lactuca saligna TaxID=75948 RepID=A0AA35W0I9_LACSI|nr:unnamed protein product [Lactuca saligna]
MSVRELLVQGFYMDPIYNERHMLSKESGIYSFVVVMFEMSSGMMAYNARHFEDKELYLIDLVRSYYDHHKLVDGLDKLIDPTIKDLIHMRSFDKFNEIAHECINFDFRKRPTVNRIIKTIDEALNIQAFWKGLLSPDYQEIIERAVSPLGFASKRELYFCLSDSHILLDRGYVSFQLDMKPGKTYLVFRTTSNSEGLSVPAKTMVRFGGIKMETENVYLQRPDGSEKWQENDVFPHRRKDGWMEIKLGEFEYNEGDVGEIEMAFE